MFTTITIISLHIIAIQLYLCRAFSLALHGPCCNLMIEKHNEKGAYTCNSVTHFKVLRSSQPFSGLCVFMCLQIASSRLLFFVKRQGFSLLKQSVGSRSVLQDRSRSLRLFWQRKPHFTDELYKTDLRNYTVDSRYLDFHYLE